MDDYILFIILLLILFVLFNISLNNNKLSTEQFYNTDINNYYSYIISIPDNDPILDQNTSGPVLTSINYQLVTFSQLNFNLQKKIFDKIINNEILKNNTEQFQNNTLATNVPFDINSIFNKTYEVPSFSLPPDLNIFKNYNMQTPNNTEQFQNNPSITQQTYSLPNFYRNLFDIKYTDSSISNRSVYRLINDIVFAVRTNQFNEEIINNKQELLFDENNIINYSVPYLINNPMQSNSLLSICNGILTVSSPNDLFNITNNNKFEVATISNNKISDKYIKLTQIDDLPVYLIDLTNTQNNIKIYKNKITV